MEIELEHFTQSVVHEIIKTAICARIKGSQYFSKLNLPITFEQFIALDTISYNPDICQRDLSKLTLKDRSNTGRILSILEENGFVSREAITKNNRLIKSLRITPKGEEILEENREKIRKDFSKVFDYMKEEEFERLRELLVKFQKILSLDTSMQI